MHQITCATVSCRTPSAAAPGDVSGARLELVCSTALASTVESMAVLRGRSSRQKDALLLTFRQAHEAGWLMPISWALDTIMTLNNGQRLQHWDGLIPAPAVWAAGVFGKDQNREQLPTLRQAHPAGWGMPSSCQTSLPAEPCQHQATDGGMRSAGCGKGSMGVV